MPSLQSHEAHLLDDSPESWLATLGDAKPLYATLPTPGAPNELAAVELLAKALKTPLLPWQRYVARVITEKNPDGSYRYPNALVSVPRQSGKTTLLRAVLTARALKNPNRRAFMTAQTGQDARSRLFDLTDQLELSVIGKTIKVRRAADSPRVQFGNKSRIGSFSPTPESLHGYTFADCLLDEIFAYTDVQGNNLIGAITPAQQTIRDRQLLMCSTKGTPASAFLNDWINRGKEAVASPDSQIAYFEWSLAEGLDAFDPDNWLWHPGLVGGLIQVSDIAAAAETMSKSEFTRSFMNRQTETLEAVLDVKRWEELEGSLTAPRRSQVAVAAEVAYDRSRAAVVAAWREGKRVQARVLRSDSGTSWLAPYLQEIYAAKPLSVGMDKYAQNSVIASELAADAPEMKLKLLKPEDFKTASVSFKARIEDGTITHDGHLGLRNSIATAQSRTMGESWVFSHHSEPELIAAVTACRLLDEIQIKPAPLFYIMDD